MVGVSFCVVLALLLRESPPSDAEVTATKKKTDTPVVVVSAEKAGEDTQYIQAVKDMMFGRKIWLLGLAYALLT
jgi:sugar phosphate permease